MTPASDRELAAEIHAGHAPIGYIAVSQTAASCGSCPRPKEIGLNMGFAEFVYTVLLKPKPFRRVANALILRALPRSLRVGPARIHINPTDPVISGALCASVYERPELSLFRRACRGDMFFIDVGANVGLYTALAMHQLGGAAQVVSLEPHPESYGYLLRTVDANRHAGLTDRPVHCLPVAAGVSHTRRKLFLNPTNKGDNRLYECGVGWEAIEVAVSPLDHLVNEFELGPVGFIKIDVQGYEGHVLRGCTQLLKRSSDILVMMELWPKGLREAGDDPADHLAFLMSMGFALYELDGGRRHRLRAVSDPRGLIESLPGRHYTTVVATKGSPPMV